MTRAKDISKILTDANISGTLDVTGETTLATHLNLGDNDKIKLGAGSDLQIYHNGSASYISEQGTGNLVLGAADSIIFQNAAHDENMLVASQNGAVSLYHDNSIKLATASGGVDITGGFTATANCTITRSDNNAQLTLISTDADDSGGPILDLFRNSSSPADGDVLGLIRFKGEDAGGNETTYSQIIGFIQDEAGGAEDGTFKIETLIGGSSQSRVDMTSTETVFNEGSQNIDFRVESNGNANMLFVDGGNDAVGIGNNNPSDFGSLTDNLVIGTTSGENGMTIASGTSNSGRIQFADNTSSPFRGAIEYAHSNDHLFFYTAGSQQLKITNSGFIQSPPTAGNTVSSSANMFITSGGEFAKSTSSRRYKNTINDATHGLTELLKLRSVTYKGNNDGDTVFGGLIAEEVHDAGLTEFVQYDDEDRPDSLHYTHMVALCIKAIQELKAENTALANRITTLEGA